MCFFFSFFFLLSSSKRKGEENGNDGTDTAPFFSVVSIPSGTESDSWDASNEKRRRPLRRSRAWRGEKRTRFGASGRCRSPSCSRCCRPYCWRSTVVRVGRASGTGTIGVFPVCNRSALSSLPLHTEEERRPEAMARGGGALAWGGPMGLLSRRAKVAFVFLLGGSTLSFPPSTGWWAVPTAPLRDIARVPFLPMPFTFVSLSKREVGEEKEAAALRCRRHLRRCSTRKFSNSTWNVGDTSCSCRNAAAKEGR